MKHLREVPVIDHKKKEKMDTKEEEEMNVVLDGLRERSKRRVMREYKRGDILWDNDKKIFTDKDGKEITDLKYKGEKNETEGGDM